MLSNSRSNPKSFFSREIGLRSTKISVDEHKLIVDQVEYRLLSIRDVSVHVKEKTNSKNTILKMVGLLLGSGLALVLISVFSGLIPSLMVIGCLFLSTNSFGFIVHELFGDPHNTYWLHLETEQGPIELLQSIESSTLETIKGAIFSAREYAQAKQDLLAAVREKKQRLLAAVKENMGRVSLMEAAQIMKVDPEEAEEILDQFVKDKHAKLEFDRDKIKVYYFPFTMS